MDWKEIIGISASVLILISMVFKTTSVKGRILMRSLNIAGSVVFMVYGILLPAWSTAILNGMLIFVNLYHLVKTLKRRKQRLARERRKKEKEALLLEKASVEEKSE